MCGGLDLKLRQSHTDDIKKKDGIIVCTMPDALHSTISGSSSHT